MRPRSLNIVDYTTMASAAALFDRQQLKSREDMLALGQLLNDTMQEYIEVRSRRLSKSFQLPVGSCPEYLHMITLVLQREGNTYDPMTIEKMEASTVGFYHGCLYTFEVRVYQLWL